MRARIVAMILAALVGSLLLASPALAKQESLGSQLNGALSGLQQAAASIQAGLQATTPAAKRAQAQQAIATLEAIRPVLQAVLTQNTTDFVRSRAQAVLDQLNEGVADLQEGVAGPDAALDAKLGEALAQILEAIEELRPAIPQEAVAPAGGVAPSVAPAPVSVAPVSPQVVLPPTGEPVLPAWWAAFSVLALGMGMALKLGLRLRLR